MTIPASEIEFSTQDPQPKLLLTRLSKSCQYELSIHMHGLTAISLNCRGDKLR